MQLSKVHVDGAKIRALRTGRSLSVEQLAVLAGISPSTMRKLETDPATRAKLPFVLAVAGVLDVPVEDITVQDERTEASA